MNGGGGEPLIRVSYQDNFQVLTPSSSECSNHGSRDFLIVNEYEMTTNGNKDSLSVEKSTMINWHVLSRLKLA